MPTKRKPAHYSFDDKQLKYLNNLKSSFQKASAKRRHKIKQEAYNTLKRISPVKMSQEDKEVLKSVGVRVAVIINNLEI
jgi:hypothetical protein